MTYRVLDLFSGIGGFSLGLERTGGFQTVAFCEIDPFCRRVLAKHWPDVPCHDDVTTREFQEGEADVICGGFPCQDVSHAGKRAGLAGSRSGLYRELVRALRVVRPRYGLVENVAALLNDGMGTVLGDLATSGFDAEWDCVPACAVGAPHERDRVWIVAHANGEGRPQSQGAFAEIGRWAGDGVEARSVADAPDVDGVDAVGRRHGAVDVRGQRSASAELCGGAADRLDDAADCASDGRGQGRTRRPPDSFARVRDEARRNAADPYGARLAFREGIGRDAWDQLSPAQRDAVWNERQSIWPDEPALSGMDDVPANWMDRIKSTGNAVVPRIPELIGRALLQSESIAA